MCHKKTTADRTIIKIENQRAEGQWVDENKQFQADRIVELNLSEWTPCYDEQDAQAYAENGGFEVRGCAFYNKLMFGSYGIGSIPENRAYNRLWGIYNMETKELTSLGEVGFHESVASWANYVVMHEKDYYCVWGTDISPDPVITKLSATDNSVTTIKHTPSDNILIPFYKADEDHFVYLTYTGNDTVTTAKVFLYDCSVENDTLLLAETYDITDKSAPKGNYIEHITAVDGFVYVLERFRNGNADNRFLKKYDLQGNLLQSYSAGNMDDYLHNSMVLYMTIQNDYILIVSHASLTSSAFFKINGDTIEPYLYSSSRYSTLKYDFKLSASLNNICSSEKFGYMIFYYSPASGGYGRNFCVLDTKNGKVTEFKLLSDQDIIYTQYIRMDENGNLLLGVSVGKTNNEPIVYYIDHDFIEAAIR